jgi:quercetin dioxygenase-like cupin family protein
MNRRMIIASIGALLARSQPASAQPAPKGKGPVFQHDLPDLDLRGWSVTTVEVDYAPGGSSKAHRHPGLTFAYVLEGEIASKVGDEPEKTYATGEMWMETPGQLHAVSRNASSTKPARLLAILLAEKGKPLTTPA